MGTLLDTTVFIEFERSARQFPAHEGMPGMAACLARELGTGEEVGMAAITASELLHGVHRASPAHRGRREAFVETVILAFPPIGFDLLCARAHARLWAELATSGTDIGAHDRMVAATAIACGWRVATANVRHFARIPALEVICPDLGNRRDPRGWRPS